MKIALCMPFKNDADSLRNLIHKIPPSFFDYLIFLDTGSTDASEMVIRECIPDALIFRDIIDHIDFGRWRNALIAHAERLGCDWCFMLDSDEAMMPETYALMHEYAKSGMDTVYRLSRIDFVGTKHYVRTDVFPDWQGRLFKLNIGYSFAPKVHAQIQLNGQVITGTLLPHLTIYHYGWTRDMKKKILHYYNAERSLKGLPLVDTLPDDVELSSVAGATKYSEWKITKFFGTHP